MLDLVSSKRATTAIGNLVGPVGVGWGVTVGAGVGDVIALAWSVEAVAPVAVAVERPVGAELPHEATTAAAAAKAAAWPRNPRTGDRPVRGARNTV
jgi:hypothetical protein